MVLVIDTSSACSALALIRGGEPVAEDIAESGREYDLPRRVSALTDAGALSAVAVALGPGSFTGLRVGVSYGLGLALGLEVPLLGLESLRLQAARASGPAIGLVEAGRGRLYWLEPLAAEARHGEARSLPRQWPAVGWLRDETAAAVRSAGVRLLDDREVRGFGEAAAGLLGKAVELGYDTVRLQYMQSFGATRG